MKARVFHGTFPIADWKSILCQRYRDDFIGGGGQSVEENSGENHSSDGELSHSSIDSTDRLVILLENGDNNNIPQVGWSVEGEAVKVTGQFFTSFHELFNGDPSVRMPCCFPSALPRS